MCYNGIRLAIAQLRQLLTPKMLGPEKPYERCGQKISCRFLVTVTRLSLRHRAPGAILVTLVVNSFPLLVSSEQCLQEEDGATLVQRPILVPALGTLDTGQTSSLARTRP